MVPVGELLTFCNGTMEGVGRLVTLGPIEAISSGETLDAVSTGAFFFFATGLTARRLVTIRASGARGNGETTDAVSTGAFFSVATNVTAGRLVTLRAIGARGNGKTLDAVSTGTFFGATGVTSSSTSLFVTSLSN